MTVATFEPSGPLPVTDPTGGRLVAWASGLSAAHQLGTALCPTSFVPQHFKNKPDEAAAAILYGDEVGLSPMQSLQGLYVIGGKPAPYARVMVAIVLAAGHEVWTVSKSDQSVTVAGKRRGSSHVIEETWTYARAKKAGYTSNKKYETDPQSMLYARAASDVCRQIAADSLAGLAYSVEELELLEPAATVTVSRTDAPKRTAQRKAIEPVVVPEPDLDPQTDDGAVSHGRAPLGEGNGSGSSPDDTPAPSSDPVTPAQIKMLAASMNEAGITDRADALAYVASVIGRDVASRNELTKDEASRVIDSLVNRGES